MTAGGPQHHAGPLEACEAAVASAARKGLSALVSASQTLEPPDALRMFRSGGGPERFYFERPAEGLAVVGCGAAAEIESEGARRFADAAVRARELFTRVHRTGPAGPLLVGGFAFADAAGGTSDWSGFPAGRLVLPRVTLFRRGDLATLTVTRVVRPGSSAPAEHAALRDALERERERLSGTEEPDVAAFDDEGIPDYRARADGPLDDFRERVAAVLSAIGASEVEKVVVARRVRLSRPGGFAPEALLETLRRTHPACASFAVSRPGAVFVGATPERLVRLDGGRVETAAVAGSAPRGRNPVEDERLATELKESKKEQAEHAVVVRALRDALASWCDPLVIPEAPRVLRLEGIQHLETPIAGELRREASLLELVGSLHPTPAVAGAPRDAALRWLAANEGLDRGWYAGPLGFVDDAGSGEFAVALRSALLRSDEAQLFAGAGIVEGSRPDAELRETRLKLRALLLPLLEI